MEKQGLYQLEAGSGACTCECAWQAEKGVEWHEHLACNYASCKNLRFSTYFVVMRVLCSSLKKMFIASKSRVYLS